MKEKLKDLKITGKESEESLRRIMVISKNPIRGVEGILARAANQLPCDSIMQAPKEGYFMIPEPILLGKITKMGYGHKVCESIKEYASDYNNVALIKGKGLLVYVKKAHIEMLK